MTITREDGCGHPQRPPGRPRLRGRRRRHRRRASSPPTARGRRTPRSLVSSRNVDAVARAPTRPRWSRRRQLPRRARPARTGPRRHRAAGEGRQVLRRHAGRRRPDGRPRELPGRRRRGRAPPEPATATVDFVDRHPEGHHRRGPGGGRRRQRHRGPPVRDLRRRGRRTRRRRRPRRRGYASPPTAARPGAPSVDAAKVRAWVEVRRRRRRRATRHTGLRYLDAAGTVRKVAPRRGTGARSKNAAARSSRRCRPAARRRHGLHRDVRLHDRSRPRGRSAASRRAPRTWPTRPRSARSGSTSTSAGTR